MATTMVPNLMDDFIYSFLMPRFGGFQSNNMTYHRRIKYKFSTARTCQFLYIRRKSDPFDKKHRSKSQIDVGMFSKNFIAYRLKFYGKTENLYFAVRSDDDGLLHTSFFLEFNRFVDKCFRIGVYTDVLNSVIKLCFSANSQFGDPMVAEVGDDRLVDLFSIPIFSQFFPKRISLSTSGEIDMRKQKLIEAKAAAAIRVTSDFKLGCVLEVSENDNGKQDYQYEPSLLFRYLINSSSMINGTITCKEEMKNAIGIVDYNFKLDEDYSFRTQAHSLDGFFFSFIMRLSPYSLCTVFFNLVKTKNFKPEVGLVIQNDIEDGVPKYK